MCGEMGESLSYHLELAPTLWKHIITMSEKIKDGYGKLGDSEAILMVLGGLLGYI